MKHKKLLGLSLVALSSLALFTACGNKADNTAGDAKVKTIALITDVGGVDDRSFNQSAWEGMQAWGKEHGVERGNKGFQYFQSTTEADYIPNIDQALSAGFNTIFGTGFKLEPAIKEQAERNPETNFVIVDEEIQLPNVASATFKDQEAAYLAGIAAAHTTKTNVVGYVGGVKGTVIGRFEAGYLAGVKAGAAELNKDIKILNQYAGAFDAPDKGRSIAQGMYAQNADVIFHAAAETGNGIFQEAKSLNESRDSKVWVIGVDRDQSDEGRYQKNGKEENFTLASTLKGVGAVIKDIAERTNEGEFPGGKHDVYGLKEDGVGLADQNLSAEAKKAVEAAKEKIISGELTVPEDPKKA